MVRIPGPAQGPKELEITLRRSAQARRISLRVSGLDGQVTLTLPSRVRESEGLAFAKDRAAWIVEAQSRVPQGKIIQIGLSIPIEGQAQPLVQGGAKGAVQLTPDGLVVPGDPGHTAKKVGLWLKTRARMRLNASVDHYAARIGLPHAGITLRDTRSRWGSCASSGALMFSWRLVMAPPQVLDYVAAHEVAHLAEMNHSDRFWNEVRKLMPDYQTPRGWLKRHGSDLHSWRFGD